MEQFTAGLLKNMRHPKIVAAEALREVSGPVQWSRLQRDLVSDGKCLGAARRGQDVMPSRA